MDVRLAQARRGDADEARLLLKLFDIATARVAHARAQATDELRHHIRERSLVRHAAFDAFRHELRFNLRALLAVAVTRAFAHRAD